MIWCGGDVVAGVCDGVEVMWWSVSMHISQDFVSEMITYFEHIKDETRQHNST